MRKVMVLLLAGLIVLFAGCASMTTIHTAETLSPGSFNTYVAYVPTHYPASAFGVLASSDSDTTILFNTVEVGARVGLTNNFDLGVKLYPVGVLADAKFKFLDTKFIKGAGDLGIGYLSITSGEYNTNIIDIVPEIPFTFRPFTWGAFTLTPKSLIRINMQSNDSLNTSETSTSFLFGGTAGLKFTIGDLGSMIFEYGVFGGAYQTDHFAIAVEKPIIKGRK